MPASLDERIAALAPWFHNMELDGIWTAPNHFLGDYPRCKWQTFAHALPHDLRGQSVLDIGCNAGFHAFEMKRRGADRVVAIDADPRYLEQAKLAREVLGLDVELRALSVYELGRLEERFDIVLFMGVLYHLRHPLLALDMIRETVAPEMLVCQSLLRGTERISPVADDYDFDDHGLFETRGAPALVFIEQSYAGDPTNWWVPNRACLEAMLRSAGFRVTSHPTADVYICALAAPCFGNDPPPRIVPHGQES